MDGRRKGVAWRRPFLRALGRTGNVRLAAEAAGVDQTTAYALRKRDGRFAGAWERALGRARGSVGAPFDPSTELRTGFAQDERRDRLGSRDLPLHHASHGPPPRAELGEDLRVVRVSKKHGPQVVRAHEGRWSRAKERLFFAALFDTGNVRAAARAAGVSTTAIYNRRRNSAAFAEAWDAVLSESKAQLEMSMAGAANRALDGIEPAEPAAMSVGEAVAVFRTFARRDAAGQRAEARFGPPEPPIEEVRAEILRRIEAMERYEREEARGS